MTRALVALLPACLFAQLPDFYRTVTRVTWITRDAARTAEQWKRFGLEDVQTHRETPLRISGRLGGVVSDYIQPRNGPFAEFLERHGEGIFGLLHDPGTPEAFHAEVARLRRLGVAELMRAGNGVYFDTVERGKYALGLEMPHGQPREQRRGPLTQFAFVVRDLAPVSEFWSRLGFPAMTISRSGPRSMTYRGKTQQAALTIGWQRHGKVAYEWCTAPPGVGSVYQEYLDRHGEGVQHLGISVPDMDKAIREKGFAVAQAGAWGEEGKKGSGRYAYLDTDSVGGVTVELLWSFSTSRN